MTPPVPAARAPHMSRRRAGLTVTAGLAAAGAAIGGLWGWLAPPVHGVVALTRSGERIRAFLGNEADHLFLTAYLMLGLLSVVAVVAAALVWQWRAHRGPAMVVALTVGMVAGAALAATLGAQVVRSRYPVLATAAAPVTAEDRVAYFTQAPPVFFGSTPLLMAATLLLPAAAGVLVYALFVVGTVRDDLGGYPPVEPLRVAAVAPAAPVSPGGVTS